MLRRESLERARQIRVISPNIDPPGVARQDRLPLLDRQLLEELRHRLEPPLVPAGQLDDRPVAAVEQPARPERLEARAPRTASGRPASSRRGRLRSRARRASPPRSAAPKARAAASPTAPIALRAISGLARWSSTNCVPGQLATRSRTAGNAGGNSTRSTTSPCSPASRAPSTTSGRRANPGSSNSNDRRTPTTGGPGRPAQPLELALCALERDVGDEALDERVSRRPAPAPSRAPAPGRPRPRPPRPTAIRSPRARAPPARSRRAETAGRAPAPRGTAGSRARACPRGGGARRNDAAGHDLGSPLVRRRHRRVLRAEDQVGVVAVLHPVAVVGVEPAGRRPGRARSRARAGRRAAAGRPRSAAARRAARR